MTPLAWLLVAVQAFVVLVLTPAVYLHLWRRSDPSVHRSVDTVDRPT